MTGIPASWDSCTASATFKSTAWSPCGQFIAAIAQDGIQILDSNTLGKVSVLKAPSHLSVEILEFPTFSPNGCLLACVCTFYTIELEEPTGSTLIVWDIQTGVVIRVAESECYGKILSCWDQEIIVIAEEYSSFSIFGRLESMQPFYDKVNLLEGSGFGTYWVHKDNLQFAISSKWYGELMIDIYELQASTPLCSKLSSFLVPSQEGKFSFSSVSFHASFTADNRVVILDVQDSKILLDTRVAQGYNRNTGQFSPDGCFFACALSNHIYVWQNTPTGYILWSILRPRLPVQKLLWSPTSKSILCQCMHTILLLCPDSNSSLSPNWNEPNSQGGEHLVAYSTNQTHIVMTQKEDTVFTVLNYLSGAIQGVFDTGIKIQEIKMVDNIIYTVNSHELFSWYLEPGGIVPGTHERLYIDAKAQHIILSHDCSYIAFKELGSRVLLPGRKSYRVSLYNIKTRKTQKTLELSQSVTEIRFSPDGQQLWYAGSESFKGLQVKKFDITENWSSMFVLSENIGGKWSWTNFFSYGYSVEKKNVWVINSGGSKILWLPPHWRPNSWEKVRWEGNFVALVDGSHPVPIIIKFQP